MGASENTREEIPYHPRKKPRYPMPLDLDHIRKVFEDCADFTTRDVTLPGGNSPNLTLCYLVGMVRMERVSDYILRPMAQDEALAACTDPDRLMERMKSGALYNLWVQERDTMDDAAQDLVSGCCLLFFPGEQTVLSFLVGTEEKRAVSAPANETVLKGSRDSFVESLFTNSAMVRQHLKAPELRLRQHIAGRQTLTLINVLWIEGLTDPGLVAQVEKQLADMDFDAVLTASSIEEHLTDCTGTVFPRVRHTERPDRFCAGLAEGRVGVLVDGLPLGWLAPGVLGDFLQAGQDQAGNWLLASVLRVIRGLCLLLTLTLPGFYVAMVTFHQEMIPTRLALSIIAAKRDVPFISVFEVLMLLIAFEILQEAGLYLPRAIGQTVSIIGGLVVGTAAVEAKIVSPAVLIVVAAAGIAGYTMPSQDLAGALRIWRFLLTVFSSIAGLFGLVMGCAVLVIHLAGIESFGVSYLTPFAPDGGKRLRVRGLIREPASHVKLRPDMLNPLNKRRQK